MGVSWAAGVSAGHLRAQDPCRPPDRPGEWKPGDPGPVPHPLTVPRVWPQLRVNQEELSEGSSGGPGEEQEEDTGRARHKHPCHAPCSLYEV